MHLLILPNHLFRRPLWPNGVTKVTMVEHPRYFSDFNFHKHKLILHRSSMKSYSDELKDDGVEVEYIELSEWDKFKNKIDSNSVMFDPVDHKVRLEMRGFGVKFLESPMFLTKPSDYEEFFKGKKRMFMQQFYIWQRKRLGILVEKNGDPVGGKWSFDTENRKPLKRQLDLPVDPTATDNSYLNEAKEYVQSNFPKNPGDLDTFWYEVARDKAVKILSNFLKEKLTLFGDYEDAMSESHSVLYHSVLTPYLNIGLLTPQLVIEETLEFAKDNNVPINSLEGFVRQIIGWREYIRAVYELKPKMPETNFFSHHKKIGPKFYGEIGLTPFDVVVGRLMKKSYTHHIERLMVLGSIFLMTEKDPSEVYRWFMELFIDSYDWVMVPNVFGMSQFADGGSIVTKPYLSGSSYILKMSDFEKGDWTTTWDGLFWRFISKHKDLFSKNPRSAVLISLLEKNKDNLSEKIQKAEEFLTKC